MSEETEGTSNFEALLEVYEDISVRKDIGLPLLIKYSGEKARMDVKINIRYKGGPNETPSPYLHIAASSFPYNYENTTGKQTETGISFIDIGRDNPGELISNLQPNTDLATIVTAAKHGLEITLSYLHLNADINAGRYTDRIEFYQIEPDKITQVIDYYQKMLNLLKTPETAKVFSPEAQELEREKVGTAKRKMDIMRQFREAASSPIEAASSKHPLLADKKDKDEILEFTDRIPQQGEVILEESEWDLYLWLLKTTGSTIELPAERVEKFCRNAVELRKKAQEIPTIKRIRPGLRFLRVENLDTDPPSHTIELQTFITFSGKVTSKQMKEIALKRRGFNILLGRIRGLITSS